jgi:hypothetical protein
MSTWRIEEVEEAKDAEEVEDKDSGAVESCLARKLASFGIGFRLLYTVANTKRNSLSSFNLHNYFPQDD